MKSRWKISFIKFLTAFLILGSIPITPNFGEAKNNAKAETEPEKTENSLNAPKIDDLEIGEIVEMRTEYEKVFYEGNGKFRKEIYFEPIHKKVKGKKNLEEISANLVEDSSNSEEVVTENTIINTSFKKKMESGLYAEFEIKGHQVKYYILSASGKNKNTIKAKDVRAQFKKKTNKIIHKNVFPNIDLQNLTFSQNVKEDLVLNSYDGYHIFKFKLETDLEAEIQEDGSIFFFDNEEEKIFDLPKPFMTDSNYDDHKGEYQKSEDVEYELEKVENGYILTVIADPEWLEAKERKFPVYIDPTTSINISSDAFVMSAYPSTNYSSSSSKWDSGQSQYVLKVGYYDGTTGTCYAFLKHSISSIKNMNITSATFNVYVTHAYYASTANGLWLDTVNSSWSAGELTWNNKPSSTNIAKVDVARDSWAKFDVTNVVKKWADGSKTNYGFKLHINGNGKEYWKKVVSTTNSTLKPYLSVTYTIPTASKPTGKVYSNGDGTGYVNLSWPAVKGATGYKVWIFNGKEYESFDVGNVTSWSTKGKGIWPTAAEIRAGKYDLHQDGKGAELAIDPSPVYKNSGGNYQNDKNYWFRVSAIFSQGEGPRSDYFKTPLPDLELPSAPTGKTYSNGDGTGYIDFSWKPVKGATGYKILLFNGKEYESLDVGNVTSWTTKGKKYWPTNSEIKEGRYKLHLTDNKGAELAVDPSPVYKNSGGNYQTSTNYWIRVVAYNSIGETVNSSPYKPSITSIKKPEAPTGFTYTNMLSSNSGYVVLHWDEIAGATGYKVWIYNGKEYQSFDVGNTTTWTTQNKGIWPTPIEISAGRYLLHTDGKGSELAIDPSPVYKNSGGSYQDRKNYWFRISAYDSKGETVYSSPFTPTFGQPVEFLGTEDYWGMVDVPEGKVNIATGNLIIEEEDFSISGRGPSSGVARTYNSLSSSIGSFGPGWHSDIDMTITPSPDGKKATFIDEDGTIHIFDKLSNGTYKAPTGVYLELTEDNEYFVLKTKDQSKAYFSKNNGRLTKISDGYGNTSTYTYNSDGKLITIKDASGRKLELEYNNEGFVKKITGPSNREVTYEYKDGFLSKVTQTSGEVTTYEYDAGLLTKIYEPTHTETKPVVNTYVYDPSTNRLKEAIDPKGNKYTLTYDLTNKSLLFTEPRGNKIKYSYNEAANPIEIIEDVGRLSIKTTYKYEGNNLIESKAPNDEYASTPTEKFEYDSNGNIVSIKDSYGTETYKYNNNNDIISIVDTEGDKTTIAYEGLDAVSETDQTGKTSSIAKYQKDSKGNSNGNLIESSYSLGTASNLLTNNNFENNLTGWTEKKSNDTGTISVDSTTKTYHGISGNKSIKLTTQSTASSHGYIAATQEIPVEENTQYSISGVIKTDLTNAFAFFNVEFLDSGNKRIAWKNNRYSKITGKRPRTERQFSFKTPENTVKVRIYLEVEHTDINGSGVAWFDMVQLEKAEVSSSYNPIVNSSFKSLTNWTGSGGTIDANNGFDDNSSLKVSRTSNTQAASEYKQTVFVGQSDSDVPLHLTLTGMSKADNAKGTVAERDYSIVGKVYYTDGTTKDYIASFPNGNQEWNRAAVNIPAEKPITKIDVYTVFKGTGTVWFDDLRLIKGFVVTKYKYDDAGNYVIESEDELGYKVKNRYDEYGNKISETDAKGEVKNYEFDSSDRLKKLTLSTGTSVQYEYDKNGNMTSKKIVTSDGETQEFTYQYDENGNLIETKEPLGGITKTEYDANGNKIKTTLPNGQTLSWEYDGADRVKSEAINGEVTYEYSYDKNGNELSVLYKKENRIKFRVYDSSNRVIKQLDNGTLQEWVYPKESDKLKEFKVTVGNTVFQHTYQYNELDQNILVNDGKFKYYFDYGERGDVKTFTTGNGAGASFKYDDRGLVSQLVVGLANGDIILDETYTYDANGNRTQIKYPNGDTIKYEYGKLDQLKKEILRDGTEIEYSYDGFGNRTQIKKTSNGKTTNITSEYNIANQLTKFGQESITYDENGNRTRDGRFIYTWNAKDQLVAITKVGETTPFVEYKYDEDGRRIQKKVNSTITNYYYDGDSLNVLYETNGNNEIVRSYVYSESGQLLAMRKGNDTFFYHYNAHGDVIALTDQQGKVVAKYEYDA